jgi:hypothetical protein
MKQFLLIAALLALGAGIFSLDYTTDGKATSNREWAKQHGAPEPSDSIHMLGVALTAGGAGLSGFLFGRPRKKKK